MSFRRPEYGPPVPTTPTKPRGGKTGEGLDDIIRQLEGRWTLGLSKVNRGPDWTPNTSTGGPANKVYGQIKWLYFSSEPGLNEVIEKFNAHAAEKRFQAERLSYLSSLLGEKMKKRTPGSTAEETRNNPAKILRSPLSSQVLEDETTRSLQVQNDGSYQSYVTAPDSRPATPIGDEQEAEFSTPPSPSPMERRAHAAPQHPTLVPRNGSPDKKRKSEPMMEENSPKASRSSSGGRSRRNQPYSDYPPSRTYTSAILFPSPGPRQPSSSMPFGSINNSANTSFATEVFTQPSRGYRNPKTADTSFASDVYEDKSITDVQYPKLRFSSAATIGSLNDDDLMSALEAVKDAEEKLSQPMCDLSIEQADTMQGQNVSLTESRRATTPEPALPRPPSPVSSASKSPYNAPTEQHQVRDLPRQGLFIKNTPDAWDSAPFLVRWESLRVALELGVCPEEVMERYDSQYGDYKRFWEDIAQRFPTFMRIGKRGSMEAWSTPENFDGFTFKGKLEYNPTNIGPLFRLNLLPLQSQMSCRFQRAFGSDRFLYLSMPSFWKRPHHIGRAQETFLRQRFLEWLCTTHVLLGRYWRVFHIEEKKDKKSSHRPEGNYGYRMVLFATSGSDIRPNGDLYNKSYHSMKPATTLRELLDWFMSFDVNACQSYCKVFARLDLGLSRTYPTLTFAPSQIRRVPDTLADGSPEDESFNDSNLLWTDDFDPGQSAVMNDGCARISFGAMRAIWMSLGKPGPVPSICQARLGGAKGIWSVTAPADPDHLETWIELTPSQLKFEFHEEDLRDETFDPNRLRFEVLKFGIKPVASALHLSFIPILVNRGVPIRTLEKLMRKRLDYDRDNLLQTVTQPRTLRKWLNQQGSILEESCRDGELLWQAGLPRPLSEKIILLLESGFLPASSQYLAEIFHRFLEKQFNWVKQNLKLHIGKATNLIGIADPIGVLQPGEIHVHFSSSFMDELTKESFPYLHNVDVLVGRHPSSRRSDMQRVRAVFKLELAHLIDVVVFPSRGRFPLASKLQGGDYDGDTFWTCWEPELVDPFRNAPAPSTAAPPADLKVEQDRRTFEDLLGATKNVDTYLRESFEFRLTPSLLGTVTNFHERYCYLENRIESPGINDLANLHHVIIDAPKMGYKLSEAEWKAWVRKNPNISNKNPPNPAYKMAMKANHERKKMSEKRERRFKYNTNNALDYLYSKVLEPHLDRTLRLVDEVFSAAACDDSNLTWLHDKMAESKDKEELDLLRPKFDDVYRIWNISFARYMRSEDALANNYNECLQRCYAIFQSIQPSENAPKWWSEEIMLGHMSYWTLLKASTLFKLRNKKTSFVFHIAGRELAYIKATASGNYRTIPWDLYATLKPRKAKHAAIDTSELLDTGISDYESSAEEVEGDH